MRITAFDLIKVFKRLHFICWVGKVFLVFFFKFSIESISFDLVITQVKKILARFAFAIFLRLSKGSMPFILLLSKLIHSNFVNLKDTWPVTSSSNWWRKATGCEEQSEVWETRKKWLLWEALSAIRSIRSSWSKPICSTKRSG